jgi:hypothetical protein
MKKLLGTSLDFLVTLDLILACTGLRKAARMELIKLGGMRVQEGTHDVFFYVILPQTSIARSDCDV